VINLGKQLRQANPSNLWLLSGLLLMLLPHLLYQPILLMICTFLLLCWRFLHELKLVQLPSRWLRTLLAIGAFMGIAFIYHTIFGRNAGVALLIIMLCLKLLEMRTSRDFTVVIFLGYFVIITGFLFNQSIFIGFYMMAVVFLLTTALIAHNRANTQSDAQSKSARLALTMLIQGIPLAILLFFLFPRVPGALWGPPENAFEASTGLSDSMSPGQITDLAFDNSVAFRVTFNSDMPEPGKLYWRGPVFTHYDGLTWQELRNTTQRYFSGGQTAETVALPQVNETSQVNYTVTLEASNKHWLLALDLPIKLPEQSYLTSNYELLAAQTVKAVKRYQVTSYTDYSLSAHTPPSARDYLQLPATTAPKARQFVAELQATIADTEPYDATLVKRILNHFRTQPFYYTRTPPVMLNQPVDQFLFEAQRGFCEHYASAFVVLMRAAGIPARIVTGYLGGEFNTIGNYFIVRQSDAHAWAEVWLAGQGWIRVDPTAIIPPDRIEQTSLRDRLLRAHSGTGFDIGWLATSWKNLKYSWDSVNHLWNQWIVGYNASQQLSFLALLGLDALSWNGLAVTLFGSIALLLIFIGYYMARQTTVKASPTRLLYERYCRKLVKIGLTRTPSESAQQFAHRVIQARQDLAPQVNQITQLYNHLRYAKTPPHSAMNNLKRQIKHFKP